MRRMRDDVRLEIDVVPHEPELLARPRAGEEGECDVDALVEVAARGGEEPRHLVGRQHGLPRLVALALKAGWHGGRPELMILGGESQRRLQLDQRLVR